MFTRYQIPITVILHRTTFLNGTRLYRSTKTKPIFRDERDERVKTVEDALFRANDAYDDVKNENDKMREELNLAAERFQEESEKWNEDKEKLEQQLRFASQNNYVISLMTSSLRHNYVIIQN